MASETFERLKPEKKIRILAAAQKEFSERVFEEAKVVNICKLADIPRMTFYSYFSSLADLYQYLYTALSHHYTKETETSCDKGFEDWEWEAYYLKLIESDQGLRLLYKSMQSAPLQERMLHHIFMSLATQYKLKLLSRQDLFAEFSSMRISLTADHKQLG